MNKASMYSKYSGLQKNDASFVIDNYLRLIKWKTNANILDIGSGDGNVIFELLLPKIPKDFGKFIGIDISEEMVRFAKNQCDDPKIDFLQMDISSEISPEFHEYFDHIFSFYCLHWVVEQRQAMKNMFDMLKPGGEMLLTFLASNPIYDIYEGMAKSNKWGPYMNNLKKYISPYHHSDDPETELENLLKKEGFITHLCRVENRLYTFPNFSVLSKSVSAVNPFIKTLPENEIDTYIEDYLKEVRKLKTITIETCNNNDNEEKIHVPYKLFITFASKPV
ncbi:juvenile hormone acid O-methyltransferase-like [Tribolium madens]|uniref:juvenile hormone acid O-methyltransferase-like n=1 Tax=Tribolium madens TaxID=41895 RepID=UPI001CF721D0|nr:juvenile hormone acid O-methyltransferase-like [Tribolium madens]